MARVTKAVVTQDLKQFKTARLARPEPTPQPESLRNSVSWRMGRAFADLTVRLI